MRESLKEMRGPLTELSSWAKSVLLSHSKHRADGSMQYKDDVLEVFYERSHGSARVSRLEVFRNTHGEYLPTYAELGGEISWYDGESNLHGESNIQKLTEHLRKLCTP